MYPTFEAWLQVWGQAFFFAALLMTLDDVWCSIVLVGSKE